MKNILIFYPKIFIFFGGKIFSILEWACFRNVRWNGSLVFFSPFSIAITSLGEERANLSAFSTVFDLRLFSFVCFLFLLVSWIGCGL